MSTRRRQFELLCCALLFACSRGGQKAGGRSGIYDAAGVGVDSSVNACDAAGVGVDSSVNACDATGGDVDSTVNTTRRQSGGVSVPWGWDLRASPGGTSVFAAVVGLSDVEVLTVAEKVTARALPRPGMSDSGCPHTAPVTVLPSDFDQDGICDVLVHDLCGSYIVSKAEGTAEDAVADNSWLPGDGAYEALEAGPRGAREIATGDRANIQRIRAADGASAWSSQGWWRLPRPPTIRPKHSFISLGESSWLAVGDETLYRILYAEEGPRAIAYAQDDVVPPNLIPYSIIDDLHVLGSADCGVSLVGIGRFTTDGDLRSPNALVQVDLPEGVEVSRVRDIDNGVDSLALDALPDDSGGFVVGVLGVDHGNPVFTAYRVQACGPSTRLAQIPTVISTRRAPTPYFGEPLPMRMDYVRLVGLTQGGVKVFVAYDGYDAWIYRVEQTNEVWQVTGSTHHLHEERTDLAFP